MLLLFLCALVAAIQRPPVNRNPKPNCKVDPTGEGFYFQPCLTSCGPWKTCLSSLRGVGYKACKCYEEACRPSANYSGENAAFTWSKFSAPIDCSGWSPLDCAFKPQNPNYLASPSLLVISPQGSPAPMNFSVSDSTGPLYRFTEKQGVPRIFWSPAGGLQLDFQTSGVKRCLSNFVAAFYQSFCSGGDGTLSLPWGAKFSPSRSLIANDYALGRTNYRKGANCIWKFEGVAHHAPSSHINTFYFLHFDLRPGDFIEVFYFLHQRLVHKRFDVQHPPVPIYTSEPLSYVRFVADSKDQGTGFEADIIQDSCPPLMTIKSPYGVITDGTHPTAKYRRGLNCAWQIEFGQAIEVSLEFIYLDLHPLDRVVVLNGTSSGNVILKFSGTHGGRKYVGTHEGLFVIFTTLTGTSPTGTGFSLAWKGCGEKCQRCLPGTYFEAVTDQCIPCRRFTTSTQGSLACSRCPNGTSWNSTTQCSPCPIGTTSQGLNCTPCVPPLVAPLPGMSQCQQCSFGQHSVDAINCIPCPADKITNQEGFCVYPPGYNNGTLIAYLFFMALGIAMLAAIFFLFQRYGK